MLMTGLLVVTFVKAKRGLYQVSTVTGHGPMYHLHDCYYYNHNHCLQCMCLTLVSCHACLWLLALTCSVAEKPSVIPSRRKFESRFRNWKTMTWIARLASFTALTFWSSISLKYIHIYIYIHISRTVKILRHRCMYGNYNSPAIVEKLSSVLFRPTLCSSTSMTSSTMSPVRRASRDTKFSTLMWMAIPTRWSSAYSRFCFASFRLLISRSSSAAVRCRRSLRIRMLSTRSANRLFVSNCNRRDSCTYSYRTGRK